MIYFIALFSRFAQHYYLAKIHAVFVPVLARSRFVLLARLSMDRLSTGVAKILQRVCIYIGTPTNGAIF